MKIYRIKLSNRDEIILPEEKLKLLLASKEQLVKITFEDGKDWEMVNKAHIINAKIDFDETRRNNQKPTNLLPEPEETPEDKLKTKIALAKIRKNLFK